MSRTEDTVRLHHIRVVAIAAIVLAPAVAARAADPSSVQKPVQGVDVMGDRGRTGPDGWSWAPQTRDQVPDHKHNRTAANGRGAPNSQPGPNESTPLKPGDDPGTPAAPQAHGPGTMDTGGAHHP